MTASLALSRSKGLPYAGGALFPFDNPFTTERTAPLPTALISPGGRGIADIVDASATLSISAGNLVFSGGDLASLFIRGGTAASMTRALVVDGLDMTNWGASDWGGVGLWNASETDLMSYPAPAAGVYLDASGGFKAWNIRDQNVEIYRPTGGETLVVMNLLDGFDLVLRKHSGTLHHLLFAGALAAEPTYRAGIGVPDGQLSVSRLRLVPAAIAELASIADPAPDLFGTFSLDTGGEYTATASAAFKIRVADANNYTRVKLTADGNPNKVLVAIEEVVAGVVTTRATSTNSVHPTAVNSWIVLWRAIDRAHYVWVCPFVGGTLVPTQPVRYTAAGDLGHDEEPATDAAVLVQSATNVWQASALSSLQAKLNLTY